MPRAMLADRTAPDGRPMRVHYLQQRRWAQKIVDYLDKGLTIGEACTLTGVNRRWWWVHASEFADLKPTRRRRKLERAS